MKSRKDVFEIKRNRFRLSKIYKLPPVLVTTAYCFACSSSYDSCQNLINKEKIFLHYVLTQRVIVGYLAAAVDSVGT